MTQRGYYEKYFIIPFFRDYRNFSGQESRKDMLRTLVAWGVATLGIAGVLLGQIGLLGPEVGFITVYAIGGLWLLWSAVGLIALFARCSRSDKEGTEESPVTMLGIDKLLTTVCVLFFVLGLLMMSTTLNSGELNMKSGTGEYDGDNPILNKENVEEEAIFNYVSYDDIASAEEPAEVKESADSAVEADVEVFDPAAVSPEAQADTVTYIE